MPVFEPYFLNPIFLRQVFNTALTIPGAGGKHMNRADMKGFSLIELMVVVAIIGVISAIAFPSYQGYIQTTYHGQAQADVRICALAMDRFYSNGFTYVNGAVQCTLWSPSDGVVGARQYTLTVPTATTTTYTVRATPVSGTCGGLCYELDADGTTRVL
ncbi:MAG: type IV pilus assembly protein PilE [Candidatus Azotimanducaceae bacterium]